MVIQAASEDVMERPLHATNGKLLTVSEAARVLSAHPNSVRRWADMGLLPSYRIGRRGDRRFKTEDLHYFLLSWASV
jgi:excisionase family DNA binding protein